MTVITTLNFRTEIAQALRKNIHASLVMFALATLLGFTYYQIEQTTWIFAWMAEKKEQYGTLYGVVSTSLFGGLIPYLILTGKGEIKKTVGNLFFYLILWAFIGFLVDTFYQLQGIWFGYENSFKVLVTKVFLDQFLFSAFLTCPILTISFLWRSNDFSFRKTRENFNRTVITRSIPKTVLTNWMVWLPAVFLIYSMPAALQIPFFNLILCLFVLILSALKLD